MDVTVVDDLDRRLAAWGGTAAGWFRRGKRDAELVNRRIGTEAQKVDAEEIRRCGGQAHGADLVGNDGSFSSNGAGADIFVLFLTGLDTDLEETRLTPLMSHISVKALTKPLSPNISTSFSNARTACLS
jgi:hypothetical protein